MKEETNNLITETTERIVIDYANFSGRETTHRAEFREAVDKRLKAFLQAFIEAEIEFLEGKRHTHFDKELSGTRMHTDGYNQAKEETIAHLKELLVTLKI